MERPLTGEWKRPNACCMVRVQGGEARLQAPAAHPIRAGLASRERLGFKGQARPLIDGVWGERSLPDGTEQAQCLMRANGERDATGERSVSFAKIAGVVHQTSCSTPYRVCSTYSLPLGEIVERYFCEGRGLKKSGQIDLVSKRHFNVCEAQCSSLEKSNVAASGFERDGWNARNQ